jgi:diaminopimelate epimerase
VSPRTLRLMTILTAHGAGNTFIVLVDPEGSRQLSEGLAKALCAADGPFAIEGAGVDGAIRIAPVSDGTADVVMDHRNADGSLAEMCGNGVRVVARVATEHGLAAPDAAAITVRSLAGPRPVRIGRDPEGVFRSAAVDMGVPERDPSAAGFASSWARTDMGGRWHLEDVPLAFDVVSMGNPHAVVAVDAIEDAPLESLGRDLQSHPAFADGVNVGFVHLQGPGTVRLRVLERGVGETAACGTGACAAFAALHGRGLVDDEVAVQLPGGVLTVRARDGRLELEGPAEITSVLSSDDPRFAAVPALAADGWGPDPR